MSMVKNYPFLSIFISLRSEGVGFIKAARILREKGYKFNQNELFEIDKYLREKGLYSGKRGGRKRTYGIRLDKKEKKIVDKYVKTIVKKEGAKEKVTKKKDVKKKDEDDIKKRSKRELNRMKDFVEEHITRFLKKEGLWNEWKQFLKELGYRRDFLKKYRPWRDWRGLLKDKRVVDFYQFLMAKDLKLMERWREYVQVNAPNWEGVS